MGADALRFALINGTGARRGPADDRAAGSRALATSPTSSGTRHASCSARGPPSPCQRRRWSLPEAAQLGPAEHWILDRCAETTSRGRGGLCDFQFGEAARLLHDAIWSEYCDWYLELAKVQLAPDAPAERRVATWQVLAWVLDRYLRLLHPVMPHVTEAIWERLPHPPADPRAADRRAGRTPPRRAAWSNRETADRPWRGDRAHRRDPQRREPTRASMPAPGWTPRVFVGREPHASVLRQALAGPWRASARVRPGGRRPGMRWMARPWTALAVLSRGRRRCGWSPTRRPRTERSRLARELADAERLLEAAQRASRRRAASWSVPRPRLSRRARQRAAELEERVERLLEHLAQG